MCTHAGVFLACGVEDEETGGGLVQVAYLRNLAAPTLSLSTPLQRRPITALCLGQGSIGEARAALLKVIKLLYARTGGAVVPGHVVRVWAHW